MAHPRSYQNQPYSANWDNSIVSIFFNLRSYGVSKMNLLLLQNGMVDHDLFDKSILDTVDFSKNPLYVEHGICPSNAGENLILRPLNTEDYDKGTCLFLVGKFVKEPTI